MVIDQGATRDVLSFNQLIEEGGKTGKIPFLFQQRISVYIVLSLKTFRLLQHLNNFKIQLVLF